MTSSPPEDVLIRLDEIAIMEIEGEITGSYLATFQPLGYEFKVCISPYILTMLLDWAIRNRIVEARPDLYAVTHCRKKKVG